MSGFINTKTLLCRSLCLFTFHCNKMMYPKSFAGMYYWSYSLQVKYSSSNYFRQRSASTLPKVRKNGCLYPYFFYLQVNCAASDASFIWMPAGSLNLNLLFVSPCCVGLCQGYVNWLSAGGFVPFSDLKKKKKKRLSGVGSTGLLLS